MDTTHAQAVIAQCLTIIRTALSGTGNKWENDPTLALEEVEKRLAHLAGEPPDVLDVEEVEPEPCTKATGSLRHPPADSRLVIRETSGHVVKVVEPLCRPCATHLYLQPVPAGFQVVLETATGEPLTAIRLDVV